MSLWNPGEQSGPSPPSLPFWKHSDQPLSKAVDPTNRPVFDRFFGAWVGEMVWSACFLTGAKNWPGLIRTMKGLGPRFFACPQNNNKRSDLTLYKNISWPGREAFHILKIAFVLAEVQSQASLKFFVRAFVSSNHHIWAHSIFFNSSNL